MYKNSSTNATYSELLYDTCVGGAKHAVERAYGRLWSMAYRGEFRLALRRATSLPRGKRDNVSYKTLVRWRFAFALRGGTRGFWFIDPLGV